MLGLKLLSLLWGGRVAHRISACTKVHGTAGGVGRTGSTQHGAHRPLPRARKRELRLELSEAGDAAGGHTREAPILLLLLLQERRAVAKGLNGSLL